MKRILRCLECGCPTAADEYFCSDNCWDVWSYGDGGTRLATAGASIMSEINTSRTGKSGRPEKWEPPVAAEPGEPIDFNDLPF